MRVAILLPGEPRFTQDLIAFISNLTGYNQADWFVYITNNNRPTVTNTVELIKVYGSWVNYDPEWARERIRSMLPENNFIQSFEISDADQQTFPTVTNLYQVGNSDNTYKMFYNVYKADCLRQQFEEQNNFKYDLVIRTRPDFGIFQELDLRKLNIQENQIVMPENGWHGNPAANDQFAIGKPDSMKIYSTLFTRIKEFNDSGFYFHPESMVAHNLSVNGIMQIRGNFISELRSMPNIEH